MRLTLLISMLLTFASIKSQNDSTSTKKYVGYGIEIEVPASWTIVQDFSKDVQVMFQDADSTNEDKFFENICLATEKAALIFSLRSYFKLSKRNLKRGVLDPVFLSEGENEVAGYDSKWLIMTHRIAGEVVKIKWYYFLKNGVAYRFLLSTQPEKFDEYEKLTDEIMSTLRITR